MSETELLYSEMKAANYNFLPFSSKTLQKNALPTLAKLNCKKYAFLLTVAIFGNVSQHDHSRDDNNTTESYTRCSAFKMAVTYTVHLWRGGWGPEPVFVDEG